MKEASFYMAIALSISKFIYKYLYKDKMHASTWTYHVQLRKKWNDPPACPRFKLKSFCRSSNIFGDYKTKKIASSKYHPDRYSIDISECSPCVNHRYIPIVSNANVYGWQGSATTKKYPALVHGTHTCWIEYGRIKIKTPKKSTARPKLIVYTVLINIYSSR